MSFQLFFTFFTVQQKNSAGLNFAGSSSSNPINSSLGQTGQSSSSSFMQSEQNVTLDPVALREEYLRDPAKLAVLRHNNPDLAKALETSQAEFTRYINEQQRIKMEREAQKLKMLMANPFDPNAQRMIAEEIQRQNIERHLNFLLPFFFKFFSFLVCN